MFVNNEKDIKDKLSDKGLILSSRCLNVVLWMRHLADWYNISKIQRRALS